MADMVNFYDALIIINLFEVLDFFLDIQAVIEQALEVLSHIGHTSVVEKDCCVSTVIQNKG